VTNDLKITEIRCTPLLLAFGKAAAIAEAAGIPDAAGLGYELDRDAIARAAERYAKGESS